jgi:dihydrofolate reductase
MRKVMLNLAVSLDGYIEGPNGEYDWCFADQDYGMSDFFAGIDLIFMGRKSYELIHSTGDINAFTQVKYVFSDTLNPQEHPDVNIINSADFAGRVRAIREEFGGHIWLFGGSELISSFLEADLIDDYLLSIHPILLGGGKPLFNQLNTRVDLAHIGTETYNTGLVQVHYTRKPKFDYSMLAGQFE